MYSRIDKRENKKSQKDYGKYTAKHVRLINERNNDNNNNDYINNDDKFVSKDETDKTKS
jgi:hypothetical protein